jgi:hypothetical protein
MIRQDHAPFFFWSAIGRKPATTFADRTLSRAFLFLMFVKRPA